MKDDSYQDRHDLLDHIEALASEKTILLARIEQLVTLNETLEKALREIEGYYGPTRDIARAALKEGE